jgi:aminocarboxymuconate-semialdehyde decarboxylase
VTSWMFDTSLAALSLIVSGILDAHPSLVVLHPHVGGVLPYVSGRIEGLENTSGSTVKHSVAHYLKSVFYTDSLTTTPGALEMAARNYGQHRIVFGSDFPWVSRGEALAHLRSELSDEALQGVLHENSVPGLTLAPPHQ